MLRGGLKLLQCRNLGGRGVIARRLAAVVPKRQHGAHGHVHLAVCRLAQLLGVEHEVDELLVYLDRFAARETVDGAEIIDAGILMVYVEKPVIFA